MANYTHKKTTVEAITIKGVLADDLEIVTVTEKNGDIDVSVKDSLSNFAGKNVEISIKQKSEDDLSE